MEDKKQPFMFFPSIQSRIWAGIFSFTGIMIVVFWVAINEPARMQEFTDRSEGRSIENGATIFESTCATCHGMQGYGSGRAPALNNPQLFGYDFFEEIDAEIAAIEDEKKEVIEAAGGDEEEVETPLLDLRLEKAETERLRLHDQLRYDYSGVVADLEAELAEVDALIVEASYEEPERLSIDVETFNTQLEELNSELETLQALEELSEADEDRIAEIEAELEPLQSLVDLNEQRGTLVRRIQTLQPLVDAQNAVDAAYAEKIAQLEGMIEAEDATTDTQQLEGVELTISDEAGNRNMIFNELVTNNLIVPFQPDRLGRIEEVAWAGGLHDFVFTTIVGGRPTSASYWPEPMPAWSQTAGGPLRDDQIEGVTSYILNWDREFTIEDIRNVQKFAVVPLASGADTTAGADVDVDEAFLENAGTDVNEIVATIGEIEGDPQLGLSIFTNPAIGCSNCHMVGSELIAPDPTGLAIRAQEHADENPELDTAEHYIVQSIVNPGAFVVEGFQNVMPPDFSERLTYFDMANLVAYLMSFDAE
ncbi:MAG: c-type cytochrome [Chloroflexi bacterium]|nr:c-type cytochrome [Chloroflexota bacterium]